MWSSPTIWEMGIFQDDYSIGNFSLFFFLVNSFKSVLPLQQAGTPYNNIMLFKKCKTFINSCNAWYFKAFSFLLWNQLLNLIFLWWRIWWQFGINIRDNIIVIDDRCLRPRKLLKEFNFTRVLLGIEEIFFYAWMKLNSVLVVSFSM